MASERSALRAKLPEQQRAAEAATSEAYNRERASEAQDAATQKEADRGRQRAAEVQRRKDSDAAAATAAELVGQQQPVIGCLSLPTAGSVLLSIYSLLVVQSASPVTFFSSTTLFLNPSQVLPCDSCRVLTLLRLLLLPSS